MGNTPSFYQTLDRGISEATTAEILGLSVDTLRRMAKMKPPRGPPRRKVSLRRVIYSEREVYAYRDLSTV